MNDIDPAKMNEAERTALFRSFAKDVQPNLKPRETLAQKVAPWLGGIVAERNRGLDWKQLAAICETNLKLKISPGALQRAYRDLSRPEGAAKLIKKATRKRAAKAESKPASAAPAAG